MIRFIVVDFTLAAQRWPQWLWSELEERVPAAAEPQLMPLLFSLILSGLPT